MDRKRFLEVYPSLEIVGNGEILELSLFGEGIAIEVAARHEYKLALKHWALLLTKPKLHLVERLAELNTLVNLSLLYACQFCTELGQDRVYRRLHIGLKDRLHALLLDVDEHDWKLYDLLAFHWESHFVV